MIDRGELPAVRAGARAGPRRRADLDAFLEAGAAERTNPAVGAGRQRLRDDLASALEEAEAFDQDDDRELAASLRALSVAAMRLSQELVREAITPPRNP